MYPKILKVRSIRGYSNYALHDRDNPATSNRVAWTHVINIPTDNPHTAWRVMESTVMDADRLKTQAGLPLTGRQVKSPYRHLMLSWHPEQKTTLTQEDMILAAQGALKVLGAHKCQTLIVSHNDTPHPHVHIVYNRISPENGLALRDFNEWKKLSRWAAAYEKQHGKIYFEQRDLNNQARDRGEFPEKSRGVPRQIMDADKVARQAANDNPTRREALKKKLTEKFRHLSAHTHDVKRRHADAWGDLQAAHKALRYDIEERARKGQAAVREAIVRTYRPLWRALRQAENSEKAQFESREATTLGKLSNLFRSIDITRSAADGERPRIMTQLWKGLTSSAERQAMLDKLQTRRQQALIAQQRAEIRTHMLPVAANRRLERYEAALSYKQDRETLAFTQAGEKAKLRAQWHQLSLDRKKAYDQLARAPDHQRSFNDKADPVAAYKKSLAERAAKLQQDGQKPAPEQNNKPDRDQERD